MRDLIGFAVKGGAVVEVNEGWIFPNALDSISLRDEDIWDELTDRGIVRVNWHHSGSFNHIIESLLKEYQPICFWRTGMLLTNPGRGSYLLTEFSYYDVGNRHSRVLSLQTTFRSAKNEELDFAVEKRFVSVLSEDESLIDIWGEIICPGCGQVIRWSSAVHSICAHCSSKVSTKTLSSAYKFFEEALISTGPPSSNNIESIIAMLDHLDKRLEFLSELTSDEAGSTRKEVRKQHYRTRSHARESFRRIENALSVISLLATTLGADIDDKLKEHLTELEKRDSLLLKDIEASSAIIAGNLSKLIDFPEEPREEYERRFKEVMAELESLEKHIPEKETEKSSAYRRFFDWGLDIIKKGIEKVPVDEIALKIREHGPTILNAIMLIIQSRSLP